MSIGPLDERPHDGLVDEWVFAAWHQDGRAGIVSGHRLFGKRAWYWCALVEEGYPVLHLTEWSEFAELDPRALASHVRTPVVVDGRNCLDAEAWKAAGWTYRGLGRS